MSSGLPSLLTSGNRIFTFTNVSVQFLWVYVGVRELSTVN